jgi:hypothetical protein
MRIFPIAVLFVAGSVAFGQGIDRGSCPPLPQPDWSKISKVGPMPPPAPQQGLEYLGTVGFLATASEKGYVCSVSVVRGVSTAVDAEAQRTALSWRFRPARIGRDRVGTVLVINVPVWRRNDGSLLTTAGITVESPLGTKPHNP